MIKDRSIAPSLQTMTTFAPAAVTRRSLANGVPVYLIPGGIAGVVRLEWLFRAGKWYEPKNLVADFANRMLREGTQEYTAAQLADFFDGYGSNFSSSCGFEVAGVSLHTLSRFADKQLGMIKHLITSSVFPEKELNTILSNRKQRLAIELEKNDFLANRLFAQALYGKNHPYGRITEFSDLENIRREELLEFHRKHLHSGHLSLVISGDITEALWNELELQFGGNDWGGTQVSLPAHQVEPGTEKESYLERPQAVQTTLLMGIRTVHKKHEDFNRLYVLNAVFGGYFGSRLMTNIREEKGYTYGIYSTLNTYPHDTFLEINADVGKANRLDAIREIGIEMEKLREELISEEELFVVKNYLTGKILRSTDGPYKMADTFKNLIALDLDEQYLGRFVTELWEMTPEMLLETAKKYFDYPSLYKISVG